MTSKEELINQHIREYESRLLHIDELYAKAEKATAHLDDDHESKSELESLAKERLKMQQEAESIKTLSVENWEEDTIRHAGPMGIWDILAQKLEAFIERHE
jgi:hypothetical protein